MINVREDIKDLLPLIKEYADEADFIIEVGPEFGNGSTRTFRKSMNENKSEDKLYVTVDIVDNLYPECRPTEPFWHFVLGDSRKPSTVNKVREICGNKKADLIFIDTIHNYDFIIEELPVWKELANNDTIWLFHDTYMLGKYNHMTDAIKEFAEKYPNWEYVDISKKCNGLGALLPK